jgi:transposase-like protein
MARRTYTQGFKDAAARLVTEQGYTAAQAAKSLGVDPASIRAWVRELSQASGPPSDDPVALKAENARLREENRRLTLERESLKKATAFFAKELP